MNQEEVEVRRYLHYALPSRRDVAAVVFRHWKAMLIVGALVILATVWGGLWAPSYEAQMQILVESRRSDAVISSSSVLPVEFSGNTVSEEDLNSEVELLKGNDLLRKVVVATGLAAHQGNESGAAYDAAVAAAARELSSNLHVDAIRNTHVISVRYRSRDPKQASAVLTALASAYIAKHTEVHRPIGEFTFFDQEALRFRRGLEQAQDKLLAFNLAHRVVSAQMERDNKLGQASDFEAKAYEAQALAAQTESRIRTLQQELTSVQPRITTSIHSSENPQLMGQLKSTLLTLQLQKTDLLTKYDPGYPLVQDVERQIAATTAAIQNEARKPLLDETTDRNPSYQLIRDQLNQAQAELSGYKAQEASARSIVSYYQGAAQRDDQDNIVQQNLLRDAKTQEDAYLLYLRKSEEASINDALDRRGIVNVAIAEQPQIPSAPERSPLMSASLILGLFFFGTFTTAFALDAVDPTFHTPDELATYLNTPVLAALPKSRG